MKKRLIGGVLAASTALMLMPAAGSAEEVDTTCDNGMQPVHYSLTDLSPVTRVQVRVLCVREG